MSCRADWDQHRQEAGPIRNARMLEWKPRLIALVVGLVAIATALGYTFPPINFGWGAW